MGAIITTTNDMTQRPIIDGFEGRGVVSVSSQPCTVYCPSCLECFWGDIKAERYTTEASSFLF